MDGGESAICTFSATVIEAKVAATWNVRPTPRRQMSPGAMPAVLLPNIVMRPVVGASWPSIMAKQVLLPAPFGPMSARISPASSAKLTSRTAWKPE